MASVSQGVTVTWGSVTLGEVVSVSVDGIAADTLEVTSRGQASRAKAFSAGDVPGVSRCRRDGGKAVVRCVPRGPRSEQRQAAGRREQGPRVSGKAWPLVVIRVRSAARVALRWRHRSGLASTRLATCGARVAAAPTSNCCPPPKSLGESCLLTARHNCMGWGFAS